ncbi:hypothetical protein BTA51_27570 [Hahella sp. CCB-MM4]|uniref:alpha/beta fold hydrolase n=1 Tax=Hahella sp. (strain CCB-MM4) TaxID=1926491 RepID=UPI000B9C5676|nr:alpha/beta fold hydrolase [Hahella sp. CCB-MM4]OZG70131.1 hypothetical protein BTA51_27570 [Hahella sp. CCB-MM4]
MAASENKETTMELSDTQISTPVESLITGHKSGDIIHQVDVLIIGSGYGGSVAAFRLAHPNRSVLVLERGQEYHPGDFPNDLGNIPSHIRLQSNNRNELIGYPDALFDIRQGEGLDILVGNGLGGTSLINANVAKKPDSALFKQPRWPETFRKDPEILDEAFEQVSHWLSVKPAPTNVFYQQKQEDIQKYQALKTLGKALENNCQVNLSPADLCVTFSDEAQHHSNSPNATADGLIRNNAGLHQPPCTHCGNCVTGCNVGAKNTLMTNLIPLARTRGAQFCTGATCLSIQPSGDDSHRWKVEIGRTSTAKHHYHQETFYIAANRVILSAGTLGSTEILQRSQKAGYLALSDQLGKHFSTNGDGIAFSFGRAHEVNGIGSPDYAENQRIGPTINGVLQVWSNPDTLPITIEDGAIPYSMSKVFGEILTTSAQLHRIGSREVPEFYRRHREQDILSSSSLVKDHSQLLLIMGDDGAKGELKFSPMENSADDRQEPELSQWHIYPSWPEAALNPASVNADHYLRELSFQAGFDGGQYVPNPFWQIMPLSASSVMSGKIPSGRAISVHPLGGCGMADNISDGVVNADGQVYRADGKPTEIYEGLYVMDGAMLPTAIGVNPFLTISALSWRAATGILQEAGWEESSTSQANKAFDTLKFPVPVKAEEQSPTILQFREQLVGHFDSDSDIPAWLIQQFGPEINILPDRITQYQGLILNLRFDVNVNQWLENPGDFELPVEAELHANRIPADDISLMQRVLVDQQLCDSTTLLTRLSGKVKLLERHDINPVKKTFRALNALAAYHVRRKSFFDYFGDYRERSGSLGKTSGNERLSLKELNQQAKGFINVALMHTDYRYMSYVMENKDRSLILSGQKELAWRLMGKSLWNTLLELPISLSSPGKRGRLSGQLRVNSVSMLEDMLPQVKSMQNGPEMFMDLVSLGGLVTRSILQTHFWSFGSPTYPLSKLPVDTMPQALRLENGEEIAPTVTTVDVQISRTNPSCFPMRLCCYRQNADSMRPAPAILLVHGLAQGSRIFTTNTLSNNMAAYFYQHGYHVWTVDYRLSNALPSKVPQGDWAIDEIAALDMTAAVNHIYQQTEQPIHIFAHCVGATAVAMSMLKGNLDKERVKSVTFNAIHPWVIPSAANRTKAKIGTAVKYWFDDQFLDPLPCQEDSVARQLLDRLAFTVARLDEEASDIHSPQGGDDQDQAICDRMTFFYGRMWRHSNLACHTHDDFSNIVGAAPGDVYRHLFYFASRYQITDKRGANVYLKGDNLKKFSGIKTLFIHGEDSQVFNPYSATISAVRFSEANPETDIRLKRIPGYGHMDIVFANKADRDVFPVIRSFMERNSSTESLQSDQVEFDPLLLSPFHRWLSPPTVTVGPILRGARKSGQAISIRLWAETNDIDQATLPGLSVVCEHGEREFPHFQERSTAHLAYIFDIENYNDMDFQLTTMGNQDKGPETVARLNLHTDWRWLERMRQPDATRNSFNFLVGSCRYPGTPFEREISDRIFDVMYRQLSAADGPDKIFFIGDQIYADATANLLPAEPASEYYTGRYRSALSSPNIRKLLGAIPTHFAIDDHEFSDNWSGHWPDSMPDQKLAFEDARSAALYFLGDYRQVDSSSSEDNLQQSLVNHRPTLWYPLQTGDESVCPVFITDTRSERQFRQIGSERTAHMISEDRQLPELINWLIESQASYPAHPKFIFSGSVMAPLSKKLCTFPELWLDQDDWLGYPATLARVIETIVENQIQNVIFVGGDLHISSISRLSFHHTGHKSVTAWQLVSSGLYAPLPFTATKPAEVDWDGCSRIELPGYPDIRLDCESTLLTTHFSHFVSVNAWLGDSCRWNLRLKTVNHEDHLLSPESSLHEWLIPGSDGSYEIHLSAP